MVPSYIPTTSASEQDILSILISDTMLRSSEIHARLEKVGAGSLVTTKRSLSAMVDKGLLEVVGAGRSTSYRISALGRLATDVNAHAYCNVEPDRRQGLRSFNFDLFPSVPAQIFTEEEILALDAATTEYHRRTSDLPPAIEKRELERLVIELSWKSSRIEGNTYTLLDTEKLILENKEAAGHDRKEAQMILNHKEAFEFVRDNSSEYHLLTKHNLERLHAILVKGLGVDTGLRSRPVGVLGSIYQPLDNRFQIGEAVEALADAVARMETGHGKALVALLGISMVQPFEDGNKRTGRLMANAILLAHGLAPLSYRSIDEAEYREATLVFYELNTIQPFKSIFTDQYDFAARTYAVPPIP